VPRMGIGLRSLPATIRLPIAGFFATAISFGPARMGFGLFLPVFRDTFAISTQTAGIIAAGSFAAFFVSLPLSGWLLNRFGPRAPILVGGGFATAGLAMVAAATELWMLAAGVVLAGCSAGFAWTPYNNAVERILDRTRRAHALSVISTGTTLGVAAAGGLALANGLSGFDWRTSWSVFAIGALAMTIVNAVALRPVVGQYGRPASLQTVARALMRPETGPLLLAAVSFGISSGVYLSFAVDHATTAGALVLGPLESAAPLLFVAFGLAGLLGLFTGEIENRVGLVALVRGIFAMSTISLALMAFAPGSGWAVLVSAALQGAVVMTISATLSFWSARLYPEMPSISFTGVLSGVGFGSILGPAVGGPIAETFGLSWVFLCAAVLSLVTPILTRGDLIERVSSLSWWPGRRSRTILPAPR